MQHKLTFEKNSEKKDSKENCTCKISNKRIVRTVRKKLSAVGKRTKAV
jgi:hypothetical protein